MIQILLIYRQTYLVHDSRRKIQINMIQIHLILTTYFVLQGWVLSKMQLHQSTLIALTKKACDMVHRDQFTQCLATLGFTDAPNSSSSSTTTTTSAPPSTSSDGTNNTAKPHTLVGSTKYAQVNDVVLNNERGDMSFCIISFYMLR